LENQEAREHIIDGIVAEAERQAEDMLREAESAAADRMDSARARADRVTLEEEKKNSEHIARIGKEAAIRLSAAKRRLGLEMKESVYREIIDRCLLAFASLVDDERYEGVVREWVVEAAAGLQAEAAQVSTSEMERDIVRSILRKAEEDAKTAGEHQTHLTLSDGPPLTKQGIVLTAQDGKTAYNNQVHSRLERYKADIRRLVHQRLFQDE
jgi:vacuolar-type H+-ATPase subunit E/Vma4